MAGGMSAILPVRRRVGNGGRRRPEARLALGLLAVCARGGPAAALAVAAEPPEAAAAPEGTGGIPAPAPDSFAVEVTSYIYKKPQGGGAAAGKAAALAAAAAANAAVADGGAAGDVVAENAAAAAAAADNVAVGGNVAGEDAPAGGGGAAADIGAAEGVSAADRFLAAVTRVAGIRAAADVAAGDVAAIPAAPVPPSDLFPDIRHTAFVECDRMQMSEVLMLMAAAEARGGGRDPRKSARAVLDGVRNSLPSHLAAVGRIEQLMKAVAPLTQRQAKNAATNGIQQLPPPPPGVTLAAAAPPGYVPSDQARGLRRHIEHSLRTALYSRDRCEEALRRVEVDPNRARACGEAEMCARAGFLAWELAIVYLEKLMDETEKDWAKAAEAAAAADGGAAADVAPAAAADPEVDGTAEDVTAAAAADEPPRAN